MRKLPLFAFLLVSAYARLGAAEGPGGPRYVVLIELAGGNDGLNTVVPFRDPAYRQLRPGLALPEETLQPLGERAGELAFHPALAPLLPSWRAGDMAVVCGVGYAGQNRSHFRSIDIWETASDAKQVLRAGWLARVLAEPLPGCAEPRNPFLADGVVLGETRSGPLRGSARVLAMRDTAAFLSQSAGAEANGGAPSGADGEAWLEARRVVGAAAAFLRDHPVPPPSGYPDTAIGRQLAAAAELMRRGLPVPFIKTTHRGFDTHVRQAAEHGRLLAELAEAVAAFRRELRDAGLWDRTLALTYSEFGRRAAENGSEGTDHGAASVLMAWGGRVRGGVHGSYPSLTALDNGDLVFAVDYREVWAGALRFAFPADFAEAAARSLGAGRAGLALTE